MNKTPIIFLLQIIIIISCSEVSKESSKKKPNFQGETGLGEIVFLNRDGTHTYIQDSVEVRVGEWKEFWDNGVLKSHGEYYPVKIFVRDTTIDVYSDEIIAYMMENKEFFPKHGKWEYFDSNSKLIKKEFYNVGRLIYEINNSYQPQAITAEDIKFPDYFFVTYYSISDTSSSHFRVNKYKYTKGVDIRYATDSLLLCSNVFHYKSDSLFLWDKND